MTAGIPIARVLLAVHHASGQGRFQPFEFVPLIRRHNVVALLLDQIRDDLRRRPGHRLRPLVGQGLRGHLPGEHVRDHQPKLVAAPGVLAEIDEVRLQAVVRPLRRRFAQAPGLGRQDLPGHVAAQRRLCSRTREVRPCRKLPSSDLIELPGVPHVEISSKLLEQPDGLLEQHDKGLECPVTQE